MRDAISMLEKCAGYSKDLCITNVIQSLGNFSYETFIKLTNNLVERNQQEVLRIIEDCFNNISRDPEDVIFDKCLYYEACLRQLKKEKPFDGNKIYY